MSALELLVVVGSRVPHCAVSWADRMFNFMAGDHDDAEVGARLKSVARKLNTHLLIVVVPMTLDVAEHWLTADLQRHGQEGAARLC